MFRIIVKCDPYNARKHYHGQEVIRHDGLTPVEWVKDDNFGAGYSEEDAKEALFKLARQTEANNDSWSWEDDSIIAEKKARDREDLPFFDDSLYDWYQGEGIYMQETLVLKKGNTSFQDDTITYMIDEF